MELLKHRSGIGSTNTAFTELRVWQQKLKDLIILNTKEAKVAATLGWALQ